MNEMTAAKIGMYEISKSGELEAYAQEKVNEVAKILITKFPEVAENEPEMIGKWAKELVKEALSRIVES